MVKEMIIASVSSIAGYVSGWIGSGTKHNREKRKIQMLSDKHEALFMLMNQWVRVKQKGKGVVDYLNCKGYKKVAIYGMGYAGETLVGELHDSDIEIVYGVDREADNINADFKVVEPDEKLGKADVMIVTAITFFDEIADDLCRKVDCPIISLEDILYKVGTDGVNKF